MNHKIRPRLSEVARLAGVSVATASRALSNPDLVAEATRRAVASAAESCGYSLNFMARSLRTQKSNVMLAVLPELDNHFYPEIVRGIEEGARSRGYSIMLGFTRMTETRERHYYDMLSNRRADGLLAVDDGLQILLEKGYRPPVPFVELMESYSRTGAPSVRIDDRAAAQAATGHLVGLGHHHIGHIAGQTNSVASLQRIAGYRDALVEAGLAYDPRLVIHGEYNIDSGARGAAALLTASRPPTAIFCANDATALGVLRHCYHNGISVPAALSVIGMNDVRTAASAAPPLTTIRQPSHQLGMAGSHLLADLIEGNADHSAEVVLPFELVVRDSTAPPPHS